MATPTRPSRVNRQQDEAMLRYQIYSRLQSTSVAIGESFPIPEIVAIGGQSDGKSSLLEAFLGFRFNVREVEMGTRRPLIVQMNHDATAQEPRCRLQDEDTEEYGPPIYPETAVADAIVKRTEDHLRRMGGVTVSAKPIVMKVEYAYCPNLTIIDTPGFILKARNGEGDRTPEDILSMVKAQAQPAHRLILFLQQSSVEWASSLWLNVIQEVDPNFQRTIFVASKFDNRLKEFQEKWEVDKYLAASGYLPPNVKPFFVALPKDQVAAASSEWRKQMAEVDVSILKHLREGIKGGFDEERFGSRMGFSNLKRFLEDELARRYREATPHVLTVLQDKADAAMKELSKSEVELRAAEDVGSVRSTAMRFASNVSQGIQQMLEGCTNFDPQVHGMNTDEERSAAKMIQWPGVNSTIVPPNAGLRLFGGAAFERCLNEFQVAAHALRFPTNLAMDRVANLLLAYKGRSGSTFAPGRAAEDIARQAARDVLGPLLDMASSRLAFVLRRVFDAASERALSAGNSKDTLRPYVVFHASLRSAHQAFLSRLEDQTRQMLRQHLDASTSEFAMNLMASMPDIPSSSAMIQDEEDGQFEIQPLPIQSIAHRTIPETPSPSPLVLANHGELTTRRPQQIIPGRLPTNDSSPSRRANKAMRTTSEGQGVPGCGAHGGSGCDDVLRQAESLFNKIRFSVAQQNAPTTLKAAFLDPLKEKMALEVLVDLFAKPDVEFMAMFTAPGVVAHLQIKREGQQKRLESLLKLKEEFGTLVKSI